MAGDGTVTCNEKMASVAGGGFIYCNAQKGHAGQHTHTYDYVPMKDWSQGFNSLLPEMTSLKQIKDMLAKLLERDKDFCENWNMRVVQWREAEDRLRTIKNDFDQWPHWRNSIEAKLETLLEAKEDTARFRKMMVEENARNWNQFMAAIDGLSNKLSGQMAGGFDGVAGEIGEAKKQLMLLISILHDAKPRKRAAKRRRK